MKMLQAMLKSLFKSVWRFEYLWAFANLPRNTVGTSGPATSSVFLTPAKDYVPLSGTVRFGVKTDYCYRTLYNVTGMSVTQASMNVIC